MPILFNQQLPVSFARIFEIKYPPDENQSCAASSPECYLERRARCGYNLQIAVARVLCVDPRDTNGPLDAYELCIASSFIECHLENRDCRCYTIRAAVDVVFCEVL